MVDGRRIGRDLAAAPHVQCVTILARAFDGQDCLFDNQAALARHIGFLLHAQVARASTVTTTSPALPLLPFPTTTTTSEVLRVEAALPIPSNWLDTTCIHLHLASLRGSYLTGTMHTGDTLEATLASLCQVWQREGQLEPDFIFSSIPGVPVSCLVVGSLHRVGHLILSWHRLKLALTLRSLLRRWGPVLTPRPWSL